MSSVADPPLGRAGAAAPALRRQSRVSPVPSDHGRSAMKVHRHPPPRQTSISGFATVVNRLLAFLKREKTDGAGDLEAGRTAPDNQTGTENNRPEDNNYTPMLVTIGPYHRSRSSTSIENEKQECVVWIQDLVADDLVRIMQGLEQQTREFYGDGVTGMTAEDLVSMLLHDGCYLLRRMAIYEDELNYKFGNTEHRDVLYLIENQMPFFVLEEINQHAGVISQQLSKYLEGYVRPLLAERKLISKSKERRSPEAPSHLLHLVHTFFHPVDPSIEPQPQPLHQHNRQQVVIEMQPLKPTTGRWRRATDYRMDANLTFMCREFAPDRPRQSGGRIRGLSLIPRWIWQIWRCVCGLSLTPDVTCVLDVRLERGTLWIPYLKVESNTWTLLRNLMALEEQKQMTKRPVTAYCMFMSQVACTVEDVQLLVDAKIVEHFLPSNEVAAEGFADLCNGVVLHVDNIDHNYLKPIWHQLDKRCRSRWCRCMGSFWQNYCSKGHRLAYAMTFILGLCAVLQSIYAPIAFHLPK